MKSIMYLALDNITESKLAACEKMVQKIRIVIQDTVHIGTKLRNKLLNLSALLPMGEHLVSITHVTTLLRKVPKEIHGIVRSDIMPQDRQNFSALQKQMEDRILNVLQENVIGSEGTYMYLFLCKQITSSFLDEDISAIERVYRIWHALFFLRAWRNWLQSTQNDYNLKDNFISRNVFDCIEINAHSLIYLILKLRNKPEWFHPHLFSSHPCEHQFRHLRSMGTANFTKINFTLFELLHVIARVELMSNISYKNKNITFPKIKIATENQTQVALPTDEDIAKIIQKALADALECASRFGMISTTSGVTKCVNQGLPVDKSDDSSDELEATLVNEPENQHKGHDKTVEIANPDGSTKIIRKSTLLWLLLEDNHKLSADRLKRVQCGKDDINAKQQKRFNQASIPENCLFFKFDEIAIGHWCFFEMFPSEHKASLEQNILGNIVLGEIRGFRYAEAKNIRERMYKFEFVDITNSNQGRNEHELEALATWYTCDANGVLTPIEPKRHFFINLKQYVGTTSIPVCKQVQDSNKISLKLNVIISNLLLKLVPPQS